MTIKNIGISPINISDVKFLAPNNKDFSMISGSKSFTLGVGDTAKMDLRFSANSVGHQSGFISFEYNNGASSSQVQLYAEGIDHGPKIQSEIFGTTDLKCEDSKLDSIKILNQGDIDLKLDDAKLSGANSDEFQLIDNIAGITIPSNKEYFLKYLFKPKSDGNKIAELNIKSNSSEDNDLYLQLEANYSNSTYSIDKSIIDIGTICPNQTIDTSFVITNNSDVNNLFDSKSSNKLQLQNAKQTISGKQSKPFNITFTGQTNEGLINESISIEDTICKNVKIIEIIGKVENSKIEVQAGTIIGKVGNIASTDLILENKKSHKITITDTSSIAPFYFDNLTLPITLDSAEKKTIKVNYQVKDKTIHSIPVSLISNPCSDTSLALITNKSTNSSAKLQINTVSAYPGDEIFIPITLKDVEDLESSNSKNLTVDLKFNATLLEPIGDTPIGSLSEDKKLRIIPLEFLKKDYPNNVIVTLKFKVGLGNDSTTSLLLTDPSSDSNDVNLGVESGVFNLLGICRAAGPRLINPNGEVKLSLIRPNPVGDNGELDIETIENGQTELYIVNLKGEKVATLYQGELAAGKQTLIISTKDLSNGTYFVILQTPTVTQKVKMEVVK